MKLFSMVRRKHPKSSRSVTSHSTYDIASLNSFRSLEDTLQVSTPEKPAEEKSSDANVPMAIEEEPSAGDAQAAEPASASSEPAPSAAADDEDEGSETETSSKRPIEKRKDTYEERERKQKEEAMMNLWRRTALPKKLPIPTRYPSYLKEPPELSYEETSSYIRRKMFNDSKIKMSQEEPLKKAPVSTKQFEPKSTKTVTLRNTYIRKDPLVSQYFSDHFNAYKKPPFKHTNVKFCK